MIRPLTPLDFKRRAVRLYGSKTAVVDGERRFTYAELGSRSERLAQALLTRGLEPGARVALLAFNSHPLLEAYYGVLEAGGVLLPLNIRLAAEELAAILAHARPQFLLVDAELATVLDLLWPLLEHRPELWWVGECPAGRQEPTYEALLEAAPAEPPPALDIDENDVAELFYTSGTTSRPKGVMLTHRNLHLHALGVLVAMRGAESDVQLHTISLFHVNGWGAPQSVTAVGGRHVMLRKFDASEVLRLVELERVTRFCAVPTMLNMILQHPDLGRRDLSSLELVNTGGAPTPPEMVRRAEKALGCRVIGGYGLTETSPLITFAGDKSHLAGQSDEERLRRQASTGLPVLGTEVVVVAPDGREVAWDGTEVGEIVVRGNVVTAGYYLDPEATREAIVDDWLHTGDLAAVDPEGYITIVDRQKDIIISGGENVSSVAIEKILYAHPAVLECAVVSAPDERWGEVPAAVVALEPGVEASAADLASYCREHLAGFAVPKIFDFVSELPKGGTGKVLKRVLRERFWQGHAKRVQ